MQFVVIPWRENKERLMREPPLRAAITEETTGTRSFRGDESVVLIKHRKN